MDETKSIFASKTFWFNLLSGVATVASMSGTVLPPNAAPYIGAVSAVANIGLRFVTDTPVSIAGAK